MNLVLLASSAVQITTQVVSAMIGLAIVLAFVRLARGPSVPDRIVALDMMATAVVAGIAVHAIATEQRVLLLAAIVLALISFLGTVAFADYLARGGKE